MEKDKIWNRNWLSIKFMKLFFYLVKILLPKNEEEQHKAYHANSQSLNYEKNGYKAEYHFFLVATLVEFFIAMPILILTIAASIFYQIAHPDGTNYLAYIFYIGAIPTSLVFLHMFKSFTIQILQARKVPYRRVNRFWYEVRTADLLVPGFVAFLVIFLTIIFMF